MTVVTAAGSMTSDKTDHFALPIAGDRWRVSWLPGRALTASQAELALRVAEIVGTHKHPMRSLARIRLDQLGLTRVEAARLAGQFVLFGMAAQEGAGHV